MAGPGSLRPSRSFSSAINDLAKNSLRSDHRGGDRERREGKDKEIPRERYFRDNREIAERTSRFRDREQSNRLDEARSNQRHSREDRQYRTERSPNRRRQDRSRSREGGRRREVEKRLPENFTISVRQDGRGRNRENIPRVDARELLDNLRQKKETVTPLGEEQPPPRKKCSFWPNCKSGDACPFVHPTQPCKYFPNCTHAAECLFLHPSLPCRFQDRCMNETCNYQHSAPFASVPAYRMNAAAHPITITCRFHPNCANINCPYVHPV